MERLFGSESRSCVQGINIRKFRGLLKPRKLKFNEIELPHAFVTCNGWNHKLRGRQILWKQRTLVCTNISTSTVLHWILTSLRHGMIVYIIARERVQLLHNTCCIVSWTCFLSGSWYVIVWGCGFIHWFSWRDLGRSVVLAILHIIWMQWCITRIS